MSWRQEFGWKKAIWTNRFWTHNLPQRWQILFHFEQPWTCLNVIIHVRRKEGRGGEMKGEENEGRDKWGIREIICLRSIVSCPACWRGFLLHHTWLNEPIVIRILKTTWLPESSLLVLQVLALIGQDCGAAALQPCVKNKGVIFSFFLENVLILSYWSSS